MLKYIYHVLTRKKNIGVITLNIFQLGFFDMNNCLHNIRLHEQNNVSDSDWYYLIITIAHPLSLQDTDHNNKRTRIVEGDNDPMYQQQSSAADKNRTFLHSL